MCGGRGPASPRLPQVDTAGAGLRGGPRHPSPAPQNPTSWPLLPQMDTRSQADVPETGVWDGRAGHVTVLPAPQHPEVSVSLTSRVRTAFEPRRLLVTRRHPSPPEYGVDTYLSQGRRSASKKKLQCSTQYLSGDGKSHPCTHTPTQTLRCTCSVTRRI